MAKMAEKRDCPVKKSKDQNWLRDQVSLAPCEARKESGSVAKMAKMKNCPEEKSTDRNWPITQRSLAPCEAHRESGDLARTAGRDPTPDSQTYLGSTRSLEETVCPQSEAGILEGDRGHFWPSCHEQPGTLKLQHLGQTSRQDLCGKGKTSTQGKANSVLTEK